MTVDGDVARRVLLYKDERGGVVWESNAFRTVLRRRQLEDCMAVEEIPEGSVKKGCGFLTRWRMLVLSQSLEEPENADFTLELLQQLGRTGFDGGGSE